MNFTKLMGWLTFLAGISVIIFTLYFSFNVLTGKVELPEFFKSQTAQAPASQQQMFPGQEEIGNLISEQLKGLLPEGVVPKVLNLLVWSILAGILIFGGAQVANLGIKLLNIKEEKS